MQRREGERKRIEETEKTERKQHTRRERKRLKDK